MDNIICSIVDGFQGQMVVEMLTLKVLKKRPSTTFSTVFLATKRKAVDLTLEYHSLVYKLNLNIKHQFHKVSQTLLRKIGCQ